MLARRSLIKKCRIFPFSQKLINFISLTVSSFVLLLMLFFLTFESRLLSPLENALVHKLALLNFQLLSLSKPSTSNVFTDHKHKQKKKKKSIERETNNALLSGATELNRSYAIIYGELLTFFFFIGSNLQCYQQETKRTSKAMAFKISSAFRSLQHFAWFSIFFALAQSASMSLEQIWIFLRCLSFEIYEWAFYLYTSDPISLEIRETKRKINQKQCFYD